MKICCKEMKKRNGKKPAHKSKSVAALHCNRPFAATHNLSRLIRNAFFCLPACIVQGFQYFDRNSNLIKQL